MLGLEEEPMDLFYTHDAWATTQKKIALSKKAWAKGKSA